MLLFETVDYTKSLPSFLARPTHTYLLLGNVNTLNKLNENTHLRLLHLICGVWIFYKSAYNR